ncbi:bifunctional DNA-binding transcriptional regulator/O6-methylguanine-DNA methyltransferase Ada [Alloacidobacterium sp.]|uniref:bifunctional DNA-binding transcriptional regulator/O6-methylguanine-DNA methyltransferase Ada n=1 Tax=Alloacidobacterium sp. TaxID=2951999 RepID=UPI002D63940A|nr:bifunctional DNA-binding transcriptional regulator/O6-methylguanine-DNA methyltransferase Ada [Alloacidobacterium sp.]HYK37245.1 bifunctional DNA-binding transcriptional regulator/O6-methylguanine-DNA methyltransferase Ada [Alloacidobacterium sp.]
MSAVQVSHQVWDRAWQMVEERKPAADMLFVYAVRTTGVYCRPSCPSRKPLRSSVEFFATNELAERAGYRACKRCAPGEAHPQAHMLTQACDFIERNIDSTIKLDKLGKVVGLSAFHTQRLFRRYLGISPRQYQQASRMEQFRNKLLTNDSVTTAMYEAGFTSSSRLYETANEHLGMTPTEYRKGGKGVAIRYTIVDSPLGKMLIAATDNGLCLVAFGSLESELEDELASRFYASNRKRDETNLGSMVKQIFAQMTEHPVALELPLDVRATAFQRRVWEALRRIPRGQTRTYLQIAQEIGQPTAVRAVARACATNPVAVVVPCHRVIGSNGSLTGYRWGVDRKKKLLELESIQAN